MDHKVDAEGEASIIKFSKPSKNVSAIITKIDSLYGGDAGINYYFEFKLNSDLPTDGLVSIQFPEVYKSLFDLESECILRRGFAGTDSYCEIVSSHLVIIRANGEMFNPDFTYEFILTNITNPNMKLDNHTFTIVSQHNNNVYNRRIIGRNSFAGPEISVLDVKSCETFEVSLSAQNSFFEASYDINLICPSFIKEASELKLYLSWSPNTKRDTCSSDTNSLYSYECAILNEFQ